MSWTLRLFCATFLLLLTLCNASERGFPRRTAPSRGGVSNRTHPSLNPGQHALGGDALPDMSRDLTPGNRTPFSHLANQRQTREGEQVGAGPIRRPLPSRRRIPVQRTPKTRVSAPQEVDNQSEPAVRAQPPSAPRNPAPGASAASPGSLNVLASFAGKNRVLVITAPTEADGYYRLMMGLLRSEVYCDMAERHMHQVVLFHREGAAGGKVRRVSAQGEVTEERLDPAAVPRLMAFLKLERGKFGMVLLRKNLQEAERYPYPVRLEAMYEVMDQAPGRRLEKARQKGFVQRCKAAGVEGFTTTTTRRPARTTPTTTSTTTTTTNPPTTTTTTPPTTTSTTPPTTTTTTRRLFIKRRRTTTTTKLPNTTTRTQTTTTTTAMPSTTIMASTTTPAPPTSTTSTIPPTTTNPAPRDTPSWSGVPVRPPDSRRSARVRPGARKVRKKLLQVVPTRPAQTKTAPAIGYFEEAEGEGEENNLLLGGGGSRSLDDCSTTATTTPTRKVDAEEGRIKVQEGEIKVQKVSRKGKADKKKRKMAGMELPPNPQVRKSGKKGVRYQENQDGDGPSGKLPKVASPLTAFFGSFEKRRRLLVITTPEEGNRMYSQQRDEYLEKVCEMAVRKLSIITIFGTWSNGTMKIDHYQLEQDKALKGVPQDDLTNQELIRALRTDLGLTFNDFYMVLTDYDMRAKQEYEVPIAMTAVLDYIDTFDSRITEMDQQKRDGVSCKKEDKSRSLENFLSRFRWRRRIFIISTPDDEEWAYQQQLYSLTSQTCNLGLRHMSVLKLAGKEAELMGGTLELYPINGSSSVDREELSPPLVTDLRNYFQVSAEYFSMLLVGKDGNVKSWYPSPMWSMEPVYDLVDSMQLRRQEMAIQQSLGMRCPDDDGREREHDGYGHRGYGY
uniref:Coiled-coil domain-containing protein 80 n=1 Tax=Gadus morhua TaxID=8049 RepID=A0A8C5A628_GADMO